MRLALVIALFSALSLAPLVSGADEVKIPGFTAYLKPNVSAAQVGKEGIVGWGSDDVVLWGGSLSKGQLHAAVNVHLPAGASATLKLTIGGQSHEATVNGAADPITVGFGSFDIGLGGYQTIELAGVTKTGKTFGDVKDLVLSGPAAKDAFFNLLPRRNAPSVHLAYPIPKGAEVAMFYTEVTPKADPLWTYYQACGFHRGYFGMQVNSPTERRIIFSVWDAGKEGVNRSKVADDNRVKLLAKGEGVVAGDFGNEGTGGHSHLVYMWKVNEPQRFLLTAKVEGDTTTYTGYFFFPERKQWGLIASFRAPRDGQYLHGLYSFNENFGGQNGYLRRLCEFGNQWIKTTDGKWSELTTAHFTHDETGGKSRRDFGAGVADDGNFYLANGGFIAEPIVYGKEITRPGGGKAPTDFVEPAN